MVSTSTSVCPEPAEQAGEVTTTADAATVSPAAAASVREPSQEPSAMMTTINQPSPTVATGARERAAPLACLPIARMMAQRVSRGVRIV